MPALKNDKDLRVAGLAFFTAAKRAVVVCRGRRNELLQQGSYRLSAKLLFDTAACRDEQHALLERCIKLLGPSIADEQDIEDLAWEYADRAILSDPPADLNRIFADFAEEAEQWRAQPVRYILPNGVIRLAKGTNALVVGPVSVRRTDEVKQEIEAALGDPEGSSEITIGKPVGLAIIQGRAEFGMTPTCWDVIVPASPKSRNETALWMIDVAISLIRLCLLRESSQSRPSLGQLEAKSGGPPFHRPGGISVTDTSISGGSMRMLGTYEFDNATAAGGSVAALVRRGNQIFAAAPGSVAERVQQGLGWLTRARTAHDRPERFLFFFTAIEALLSLDDKQAPVIQTISRHASVLLTNDNNERARIASEIRKLYEVRSALVHTGKRGISTATVVAAQYVAETLFLNAIEAERLGMKHQTFSAEVATASYGLSWPAGPS